MAERALELCGSLISGNKLDGLLSGILAKTSVPQIYFEDDLTTEDTEKNEAGKKYFPLCFVFLGVLCGEMLCNRFAGLAL